MKYRRSILKAFCLAVMTVCLFQIGRECFASARNRAQQENLKKMKSETTAASKAHNDGAVNANAEPILTVSVKPDAEERISRKEEKPVILHQYFALQRENQDLAGWLAIEGMEIDYPVMQCADDEYYLHHDFYGKDSKYGCLYVRERADLDAGMNFIIYGHNMEDGSMFGDLDLYSTESFYKEHTAISFDTLYEKRSYEIIAVFLSQIYDDDSDAFKYYEFYEADTQEEFDEFYGNIKALSLYDTGVEAQFGDTFLTLSTCAYHVKDGRLAVVAKRTK